MKRMIMTIAAALFPGIAMLYAQADTTDTVRKQHETYNPQSRYSQQLPKDLAPKKDSVKIDNDQIPVKLRKALQKDMQYSGWENSVIYFNSNTSLYSVYIIEGNTTKIYGFNEAGKPVTFNSVIKPPK